MEIDKHIVLSMFHILLIVPFFLYIGYQRGATPQWVYMATFVIGAIIGIYHGYKFVIRVLTRSEYAWINAIHFILVAPLLLYIGYHKKNTPRFAYELLLMLGFAAGGYHLFSLVKLLDVHYESALE